jgi:hypothetical protein
MSVAERNICLMRTAGPRKWAQKNWAEVGGRRGETPQPSMPPVVRYPIGSGSRSFQLVIYIKNSTNQSLISKKKNFLLRPKNSIKKGFFRAPRAPGNTLICAFTLRHSVPETSLSRLLSTRCTIQKRRARMPLTKHDGTEQRAGIPDGGRDQRSQRKHEIRALLRVAPDAAGGSDHGSRRLSAPPGLM